MLIAHAHAKGEVADDETAFLLVDQGVGYDRADRPRILFQHTSAGTGRGSRPKRPVFDTDQRDGKPVVLIDWNDHEIRDFGDDLPVTLSSELDGQDIETYTRRNKYITLGDICGSSVFSICTQITLTIVFSTNADFLEKGGNILQRACRSECTEHASE